MVFFDIDDDVQGDDPVEERQVPGDEGGVSIRDGVPCRQNLRKSHSTVAGLTIIIIFTINMKLTFI